MPEAERAQGRVGEPPGLGRRAVAVAFLAWVGAVAATSAFQVAKIPLLADLMGPERQRALGAALEGQIQAAFFLAWALASLAYGRLADRVGRAFALRAACATYVLGTLLTAASPNESALLLARIVTGLGGGGVWGAAMALVFEASGPRGAPRATGLVQTAVSVGHLGVAGLNFLLAAVSWRWLFVAVAGLGLGALLLAARGLPPAEPARPQRPPERSPEPRPAPSPDLRRHLAVGLALGFVGVAGSVHVGFWFPNLVASLMEGAPGPKLRETISLGVLALQAGAVAGILLAPLLAERAGRRGAFLIASAGAALALLGLPALATSLPAALALAPALGFFATGWTGLLAVYLPELYPRAIRATAAGGAYNLGRLATAGQLALTGLLTTALGPAAGLASGAALYLLGAIAVAAAPETRRSALNGPLNAPPPN